MENLKLWDNTLDDSVVIQACRDAQIHNEIMMIFDEAMSALDYLTQKKVSESLEKLNCTRIIVAHRLSTIKQCDKIFVLNGGRIEEEGTFAELEVEGKLFSTLIKRQQL